ncbi:signal peptide peptidase SppA [Permianibacter sp. IMCC34836]|uniref:signal peptide peptidase SppA n=1 Tax=Permianibacter fluminis TaxID=2738515 RepID=UPI00155306FD|nr:signal peptide peptidase SppA [Permianibacter fluminis]NQD37601.1 signal peptide peptidase SppA [Permianibacter fluminis]
MEKRRSFPVRVLIASWRFINNARRAFVNLLFLVFMLILLSALFSDKGPHVEAGSALVLKPEGFVVEQADNPSPFEAVMKDLSDDKPPQTELRDLLTAIQQGAKDDRIKIMVIDTSHLMGIGPSKLVELRDAIAEFKKTGKKVLARGDWYSQAGYYLAAQADEVYLDSYGAIDIDGFNHTRTFFKSALERFGVKMHVFKVGTYKSAVEPYLRDDMSPEAKANAEKWLNVLWNGYKTDVAAARKLQPEQIQAYADNMATLLQAEQGDTAKVAQTAGLVNGFKSRIEWEDYLRELVGEDRKGESFKQVDAIAYASLFDRPSLPGETSVGVIVAQGEIVDGEAPAGMSGGDSIAQLIRDAREDDSIKAVVLRVDSPGGSAFASEVIRRELEATQKAGKPVVVSMSSVAASGGYWISATADEIVASPWTITGSIGIFGMFPTVESLANEYGVHRDGVGTTKLAGAFDLARPLNPELGTIIQQAINNGYERFLTLVANGRKKTREEIDLIGQGQVWAGVDAHERGLVDKLGTFNDAVKAAAERAKLGDNYTVRYVEKALTPGQALLKGFTSHAQVLLPESWLTQSHSALPSPLLMQAKLAAKQAKSILEMNDPNHAYVHCLCEVQ